MSKYIIADPKINDGWTHLFLETADDAEGLVEVERGCRFVFDRERLELVHVDVEVGDRMVPASSSAADALLDSLLHGNPFFVDEPDTFGLGVSDHLPDWCENDDTLSQEATGQLEFEDLLTSVKSNTELARATMPAKDESKSPDPIAGLQWSRELIKQIAKDVGDAVVAHIEIAYPAAIAATPTTFPTSVRNCVFNEVMAAVTVNDADKIASRLAERKRARRSLKATYRKMRAANAETAASAAAGRSDE